MSSWSFSVLAGASSTRRPMEAARFRTSSALSTWTPGSDAWRTSGSSDSGFSMPTAASSTREGVHSRPFSSITISARSISITSYARFMRWMEEGDTHGGERARKKERDRLVHLPFPKSGFPSLKPTEPQPLLPRLLSNPPPPPPPPPIPSSSSTRTPSFQHAFRLLRRLPHPHRPRRAFLLARRLPRPLQLRSLLSPSPSSSRPRVMEAASSWGGG